MDHCGSSDYLVDKRSLICLSEQLQRLLNASVVVYRMSHDKMHADFRMRLECLTFPPRLYSQ